MHRRFDTSRFAWTLWYRGHRNIEHFMLLAAFANRYDITARLALEHIQDGDMVADVGCSYGIIPMSLAWDLKKSKFLLVDLSATPTAKSLVKYYPEIEDRFSFKGQDLCELDIEADWILATEILEHIENHELALERILKCAKKGVIISTPNELSNQNVATHVRTYTLDDMHKLLKGTDYTLWRDDSLFQCNLAVIKT